MGKNSSSSAFATGHKIDTAKPKALSLKP